MDGAESRDPEVTCIQPLDRSVLVFLYLSTVEFNVETRGGCLKELDTSRRQRHLALHLKPSKHPILLRHTQEHDSSMRLSIYEQLMCFFVFFF